MLTVKCSESSGTDIPIERSMLPLKVVIDVLDPNRGGRTMRSKEVIDTYDYHYMVGNYGERANLDLVLMPIDKTNNKIIDGLIIHTFDKQNVDGYNCSWHDDKARELWRADKFEDPMELGIFFETKLSREKASVRVNLDKGDTYYSMLDRREKYRGHWDVFTIVIVDCSKKEERIIDKIDWR